MTDDQESAPPPRPPPDRHKLLIEVTCVRRGRVLKRRHKYPVQNVPFDLLLRVTNRGNTVFPGATICGFRMHGGEAGVVTHNIQSEFAIGSLNPGETKEIPLDVMTTPLEGSTWVECQVKPNSDSYVIDTYQLHPGTGTAITKFSLGSNKWGTSWFVQRQMEVLQARTNLLLVILAGLALLEGTVGLRTLAVGIATGIGRALVWLGGWLGGG